MKKLTLIFFFGFIFTVPIISLLSEDKKVSMIENKVLTQLPEISMSSISSKRFMNNFDKYSSDQFPFRTDFLKLKNSFDYALNKKEFRNIYVGKNNKMLEKFVVNFDMIDKNISEVINMSKNIYVNNGIVSKFIVVPTSTDFYKNELPFYALNDSQKHAIDYIYKNVNDANKPLSKNNLSYLDFYTPYYVLEKYKDEYIYFNTDHHWTQLGAILAYYDFNGLPIDIDNLKENYNKVCDNFYGTYYSKAILPQIKGDEIYAFDKYNHFDITVDFNKKYNTLYSNKNLNTKNKYQYFLHGDPGVAVINGTGNGNILIFKDSYAHNFIPFLSYDYDKIHVVDPRYYKIDVDKYIKENNIDNVIFMHNIQSINNYDVYTLYNQ